MEDVTVVVPRRINLEVNFSSVFRIIWKNWRAEFVPFIVVSHMHSANAGRS